MPTVVTKKRGVKFAPKGELSFYDAIKMRVEDYFASNNIKEQGNRKMYIKTAAMLSMYFVPYLIIVTGLSSFNVWFFYGLNLLMGLGIVGIGTSVMHDSNHGAYSTNTALNNFLGGVLNVLGGYSRNWRIQHNILHHTYTNLDGLDEDIDAGILLRMSPHKKHYKFHKFQHLYAWVLYGIMNLFWVTVKDYRMILRYHKSDMLKKEKVTRTRALLELTGYKVIYVGYLIVLPILFSGFSWQQVLIGFVMMQMLAGFGLACIFQPAHVMETSEFPDIPFDRKIENTWAIHQLLNTADFAHNNKLVTWFIGGLNFQIEHHLFPQVCHVHYPKIAEIVKATAEEYDLPYNVEPTFRSAIWKHGQMLKLLGEKP